MLFVNYNIPEGAVTDLNEPLDLIEAISGFEFLDSVLNQYASALD